ncbi:hypothetical protein CEXT_430461 [Caerostris extrusa]|uniref:Secreted protein n=1 Tax=Caerostris extrusa TaxID=172846 RepID=A0AAV4XQC8_CAEEX|nr:hypothetical protein CEXT_430461 [Caerostris extrusa]
MKTHRSSPVTLFERRNIFVFPLLSFFCFCFGRCAVIQACSSRVISPRGGSRKEAFTPLVRDLGRHGVEGNNLSRWAVLPGDVVLGLFHQEEEVVKKRCPFSP